MNRIHALSIFSADKLNYNKVNIEQQTFLSCSLHSAQQTDRINDGQNC